MQLRNLGSSDLAVFPLALGGNVFGWTADRDTSFGVLDAYLAGGGNFIDTADSYSFWAPGNLGGESEAIVGEWLASRGTRDRVVLATKVSQLPEFKGIDPAVVAGGMDASLTRLGVDHVELYYAHFDEPEKPLEPTVAAFSKLVDQGKTRAVAISNFSPARITEWLSIAHAGGYHLPVAVQPPYNLVQREIEHELLPLVEREGLSLVTYWALARGFLTGKYRTGARDSDSPRAEPAAAFLDDRGRRVLSALDDIASARGIKAAAVAVAWVIAKSGVAAAIASARTVEQLESIMPATGLDLTVDEVAALDTASR